MAAKLLAIDWQDHESGIDHIPWEWFAETGKRGWRRHYVVSPEWKDPEPADCEITVSGKMAILDYRAESCRKFNRRHWMELGWLRIDFKNSGRQSVVRVRWQPEKARRFADSLKPRFYNTVSVYDEVDASGISEGKARAVLHLSRERVRSMVKRKKLSVLRETGRLLCEACGFDFATAYPGIGKMFCEVHHGVPLAELASERRTRLRDLHVLCANCHRMIHRTNPMMSVEQFRRWIKKRAAR